MARDAAVRRKVAQLALDLFDGRITDRQFYAGVDALPVAGDATIAELLELVHHAGARSWFFGVQRRSVRDDGDRIGTLVSELLRDGEGGAASGATEARA